MKIKAIIEKITVIVIISLIVFVIVQGRTLTVEDLLYYRPENLFLAFIFLMISFTLKSLSIMFPIAVLYMVTARIYAIPTALLVNTAGLCVCYTVVYFIGRFTAQEKVDKLREKYQFMQKLNRFQNKSPLFMCYMIRVMAVLPMDAVSMILGSMGISFSRYLLGSLAGSVPMMAAITLMGTSITDIKSPMFLYSCGATIIILIISLLLYYFVITRQESRKPR